MTSPILLYVEDEPNDLFFMRMAFQQEGLEPVLRTVSNGREAMDYLAGNGVYEDRESYPLPSVVLLDLNMPMVSGFAVLEWLRGRPKFSNVSVVVFSSSAREEDRVKARSLGAADYVEKPMSARLFRQVARDLKEKWLAV